MSEVVSAIGPHSIGSDRHGYGPFCARIAESGRRLALVKCRDDFGAIDEPLALWPDVVTIGAHHIWDDADYNVDTAYDRIVEAAAVNPKVKYWEYYNERDGDYAQQADLYIALLPRLAPLGIGLCLFNCASGTPQYPTIDESPYREISRACAFAVANGYKAILGLHEYYTPSDTIGRYKVLADYLSAHGALLPIAITEYGFETNPGNAAYMAFIQANDPLYMADKRVIGCALWTLGGGGWGASNYDTMLPELGEYIATVAPVVPGEDREFDHWLDVDSGATIGTVNPLTFTITGNRNIRAITRPKVITFTCLTSADSGSVAGGGTFPAGAEVTLTWSAA